jgi:hypothetical protein
VSADERHPWFPSPERSRAKRVTLWVVGVIAVVVLVGGLFVLIPQQQVIKCGIDAKGRPYAKVLIMNVLGSYHNSNWTGVTFSYEGDKSGASVGFERPAHSITTTVVHADRFPKDLSGGSVSCSTWKDY